MRSNMMMSEAAVTVVKVLETLPEHSQDRAVEHLREYIEELRDEAQWDESFARKAEIQHKIEHLFHCFDKGYFGDSDDISLYPEHWAGSELIITNE